MSPALLAPAEPVAAIAPDQRLAAFGQYRPVAPIRISRMLAQFVISSLVALLVLAGFSLWQSRRTGTTEAIRDAKEETASLAEIVVAPALDAGLERGDPASVAAMDVLMRRYVLRDSLVHARIWSASGRILYSDVPDLIGQTFELRGDAREALDKSAIAAEINVQDADSPGNDEGKLLEVYNPVHGQSGDVLLFETYHLYRTVNQQAQQIWHTFAPASLLALAMLQVVQFPLAVRLARRVRREQRDRERLLSQALDMSDAERRTIAADIHDGAVQDLIGVAYSLAVVAERTDRSGDHFSSTTVRTAMDDTRRAVRSLRSLFVEIYPPNLSDTGLGPALSDLASPLSGRGIAVTIDVPDDFEPPRDTMMMLFRVAQEAIRNIARHARASTVSITARREGQAYRMVVADDGVGFDPEEKSELQGRSTGHLGLRMLSDMVRSAGGSIDIASAPGRGTTVSVTSEGTR